MKLDKMACACKARTFEEVQSATRCATGCRRCEEFIRHFVAELIAEKDRA